MTLDRDERLAALIDRLTTEASAGHAADIDAVAREHPDLADELRELWAVAQFAHMARRPPAQPDKQRTTSLPKRGNPTPSFSNELTTDSGAAVLPREFGDFELLEEVGRGGMGVVYKARQQSLNRIVAVKMIREAHLAANDHFSRFRTEAEAAARLKHPNIVTVHEVGTVGGQAYLCMEFVDGQTLAEKVRTDGPLPPREAARLVAIIARAVEHAHSLGILHRDLKPSNILLTGKSEIRNPKSEMMQDEPTGSLRSDFVFQISVCLKGWRLWPRQETRQQGQPHADRGDRRHADHVAPGRPAAGQRDLTAEPTYIRSVRFCMSCSRAGRRSRRRTPSIRCCSSWNRNRCHRAT
ncbi:MAG: serine/threonine-protein kinase [Gemmataceae bacterium]